MSICEMTEASSLSFRLLLLFFFDLVATSFANGAESQWCSFMVAPILNLLHELHRDAEGESWLETLDISTTSIDPIALCPYHENPEVWRILNKKIDFTIGLSIPYGQKFTV